MSVMITKDGFLVAGSGNGFVMVDSSVTGNSGESNTWLSITDSDLPNMNFTASGTNPISLRFTPPQAGTASDFEIEFNRPLTEFETCSIVFRTSADLYVDMGYYQLTLKHDNVYALSEPINTVYSDYVRNELNYIGKDCLIVENTTGATLDPFGTLETNNHNNADIPSKYTCKVTWSDIEVATYELFIGEASVATGNVTFASPGGRQKAFQAFIPVLGDDSVLYVTCSYDPDVYNPMSGYVIVDLPIRNSVSDGFTISLYFANNEDGCAPTIFRYGQIGDEYNEPQNLPLIQFGDPTIPTELGDPRS